MLDFWIIEEVLRRDREVLRRGQIEEDYQRPFLDLPLSDEQNENPQQQVHEEVQERGVVVIDFGA